MDNDNYNYPDNYYSRPENNQQMNGYNNMNNNGYAPYNAPAPQQYQPYSPQQQMPVQPYGQQQYNMYPDNNMNQSPYSYPIPSKEINNTAGFVCGIGSIVFCWSPLLGIGAGITGICFSAKARSESSKPGCRPGNLVMPGLVMSIIGIVLSVVITALFIIGLFTAASDNSFWEEGDDEYSYYYFYDYEPGEYT